MLPGYTHDEPHRQAEICIRGLSPNQDSRVPALWRANMNRRGFFAFLGVTFGCRHSAPVPAIPVIATVPPPFEPAPIPRCVWSPMSPTPQFHRDAFVLSWPRLGSPDMIQTHFPIRPEYSVRIEG